MPSSAAGNFTHKQRIKASSNFLVGTVCEVIIHFRRARIAKEFADQEFRR
jgi:hypothetical protein